MSNEETLHHYKGIGNYIANNITRTIIDEIKRYSSINETQTETGASIEVLRFTIEILADRYKNRIY